MRRGWVRATLILAAIGAVLGTSPAGARPAQPTLPVAEHGLAQEGEDGLRVESRLTYRVDQAAGAINVSLDVTLTNQIPNRVSGGFIRQTYFTDYGFPVLAEAAGLSATRDDGRALETRMEPTDSTFVVGAVVDLAPNLFYGNVQTLHISYTLPGQIPRADGTTRVNPAFAGFIAWAIGDPGLTSVEIRVPAGYELDLVGDPLARTIEGAEVVLRAEAIADPATWYAAVTAVDDTALDVRRVAAADVTVTVESWPGDLEWADFVDAQVSDGLPALVELIGQPVPEGDDIRIIETIAPYLYGYSGWFSWADRTIEIGDVLDATVVLHELAHAWFNNELFDDRWILEGLAENYAALALAETGGTPEAPLPIDPAHPGAITLNSWSDPSVLDDASEDVEAFGYNASFFVLDAVLDEIGVEGMQAVLQAATDRTTAYVGDPTPEHAAARADWRRFLDLLEEVGKAEGADALFRAHVLAPDEVAALDARTEARSAYAELVEAGDGWTPPFVLRRRMEAWRFDDAAEQITDARAVLAVRDEVAATLAPLDAKVPPGLEDSYESGRDLDALLAEAEDHLGAAEAVAAADAEVDADRGILEVVGLLGSDPGDAVDDALERLADSDLTGARSDAARAEDAIDAAGRQGIIRLVALLIAAAVLALGLGPGRRSLARRRAAPTQEAPSTAALFPPPGLDQAEEWGAPAYPTAPPQWPPPPPQWPPPPPAPPAPPAPPPPPAQAPEP